MYTFFCLCVFFFQAEDGMRDGRVTGVQTCALPISRCSSSVVPAAVQGLPAELHREYIDAVMAALRPVFLAATGVSFLGFVLTWCLREMPLRDRASAEESFGEGLGEGLGETF